MGRGRAGESLKPHNFSQLGNRGSPAGFSLRFSLITAAHILFGIHNSKDAKKTQNSYFLPDLLSSLVSNSKTRVFDT